VSEGPRLHLVGDDDALDLLAELCRHLPLFQLARIDAIPDALGPDDLVVIGASHPRTRDALLASAMGRGPARHVSFLSVAVHESDAGARAILAAADLVRILLPQLTPPARG